MIILHNIANYQKATHIECRNSHASHQSQFYFSMKSASLIYDCVLENSSYANL